MFRKKLAVIACTVIVYLFWIALGPLCMRFVSSWGLPEPYHGYLTVMAASFAMAFGAFLTVRFFMGKKPMTLIRRFGSFDRKGFLTAFVSFFIALAVCQGVKASLQPHYVRFLHPQAGTYLLMLILILVCNAVQCASEEFMMRIIPSGLSDNPLTASLVTMVCFTLPHLANQEVQTGNAFFVIAYYALFGFVGTFISFRLGGFEYALAIHMANNLFVSTVCGYEGSALKTVPLFLSSAPIGTWDEVLVLILAMAFSYFAVNRMSNRESSSQQPST